MSDNSLEIFYNIKAMFMEALKNSQFTAYTTGAIHTLLNNVLPLGGFGFNYENKYIEIVVNKQEQDLPPLVVEGNIKSALTEYIYSCVMVEDIRSILILINNDTFGKLQYMIKDKDPVELMKIVNYMYSILFMGNTNNGHLFRIMM